MEKKCFKDLKPLDYAGDNKPRMPLSAYAHFIQTCIEENQKERPDEIVDFGAFFRRCGKNWKKMSEEEKAKFHQMAEESKNRYEYEMANYKPSDKAKDKGAKGGKKKRTKEPNAPERHSSAFFWFSKDERPKVKDSMPDATVGDLAKELGKLWIEASPEVRDKYDALSARDKARYQQKMSEEEKARFHQMAEESKNRYEYEMANYKPSDKAKDKGAKGGKMKRTKEPNAPERHSSAFFWFSKDERPKVKDSMPDATVGDLAKELGKLWIEASPEVRAKYDALSARDKARYQKEVKAYKGEEQELEEDSEEEEEEEEEEDDE